MTRWTRKRAFEPEYEDWVILRDGLVVGRVFFDIAQSGARPKWRWSVITVPTRVGHAESLPLALAEVKAAASDRWGHPPYGWPLE